MILHNYLKFFLRKEVVFGIGSAFLLCPSVQRNPERSHRRKNSQFIRLSILGVIYCLNPLSFHFSGPNSSMSTPFLPLPEDSYSLGQRNKDSVLRSRFSQSKASLKRTVATKKHKDLSFWLVLFFARSSGSYTRWRGIRNRNPHLVIERFSTWARTRHPRKVAAYTFHNGVLRNLYFIRSGRSSEGEERA